MNRTTETSLVAKDCGGKQSRRVNQRGQV
jgi:hypothetical protein